MGDIKMESEKELQEKVRDLYEKLETDPILEKEYLKDEKQFLQNNGFDPEQVKDVIEKIHKDRISDLAAVLKDQGDKLD